MSPAAEPPGSPWATAPGAVPALLIDADPAHTLFIDDTPGHVATARSLGMTGHVHTDTEDMVGHIDDFLGPPD